MAGKIAVFWGQFRKSGEGEKNDTFSALPQRANARTNTDATARQPQMKMVFVMLLGFSDIRGTIPNVCLLFSVLWDIWRPSQMLRGYYSTDFFACNIIPIFFIARPAARSTKNNVHLHYIGGQRQMRRRGRGRNAGRGAASPARRRMLGRFACWPPAVGRSAPPEKQAPASGEASECKKKKKKDRTQMPA